MDANVLNLFPFQSVVCLCRVRSASSIGDSRTITLCVFFSVSFSVCIYLLSFFLSSFFVSFKVAYLNLVSTL